MVTCHSSVPLVTSRLHSHWQSSTEKTSKGWTLPSSGMQHKGLLHTASCVATTRKTLNMTVLQFHSALGCSPLLEIKLTLTASAQTYPSSSCKPLKSNWECHMEGKYLHFQHLSENYLSTSELNDRSVSAGIKRRHFDLSSAVPREHQEEHRTEMQLLKRCREMGYTAKQQIGLRYICLWRWHKCWAGDHIPALLTLAWHMLLYSALVCFTKHWLMK